MGKVKRTPGGPKDQRPSTWAWQVTMGAVFVLGGLLWAMTVFHTYLVKIPGASLAVAWLQRVASDQLGAFAFGFALLGGIFTIVLSRIPELSIAGMKWRNRLYQWTSDPERLSFEAQRQDWERERKSLKREAEAVRGLRAENAALMACSQRLEAMYQTAVTNTAIYEHALETCHHQDSVLEKLFAAFWASDADFQLAYAHAMGWLAHFVTTLIVKSERSLNCTVMSYDAKRDRCEIVGEVGARPNRQVRFLPRKGIGIGGRAIAAESAQIVSDVRADPDYVSSASRRGGSLLSCPVFGQGRVIGLVNIGCHLPNAFSEKDLQTIQIAVDHVAIAMCIRQLREKSRRGANVEKILDRYLFPRTTEGGDSDDDDLT